ncbi:tetratricopeptide repeat protein [Streptomyces sp. NBC_01216]|uniref:tetratricopeptide repeat protein n=1 Tax=Streptomyces sp. NBC_01216 TaxID=2903778 RepID=UPI002E11C72B|nr:tetratricopeptide repeat protein [Streptomyces sp. NBC_01216]
MTTGGKRAEDPIGAADTHVVVTDTGNATAAAGAMAVTGYRGPAPGTDGIPTDPIWVSDTGDARAAEGGFANTGYIYQVSAGHLTMVQQRAPREPASWPHQVGVLPSRAHSFQYRAESDQLRAVVANGGTAVLGQVLTGMGGVGKTQLAADYARTAWQDGSLDVLVWVTASARSSVVTGYAQAGVELCRADPDDPEGAAQTFLAWLTPKAGATPCRWMIVLDDVADPNDLRDLWPQASPHGRLLVTTRRRDAALSGDGRHLIHVGLFTEAQAVAYLVRSLSVCGRQEPVEQLTALARDLGLLPLALAQAAAYLIDTGLGCAAYRALLADRATNLADTAPDALPDDHAAPVSAAWSLSIDRADTLRPIALARPMLHLVAMLGTDGIPGSVLNGPSAIAYLAQHRTTGQEGTTESPGSVSAQDAILVLRALHRLSLIEHVPQTPHQAVRAHQLIQRAVRDDLTREQHAQAARAAADALVSAWPGVPRDIRLEESLRASSKALSQCAEEALFYRDAHDVLFRVGRSLGETGQVRAARDYFEHLVQTVTGRLGPDHPSTLAARGNQAQWQGQAGDAAGAADAFRQLMEQMLHSIGADHPYTLTSRDHLAMFQGAAGDAAGAVAVAEALLQDRLRVQGPDHPHTLTTRGALARWKGEAGNPAGAADALESLLKDQLRLFGPDDPDTLATRGALAHSRGLAGDPARAADDMEQLLQHMLRVFGADHPEFMAATYNLAHWRGEAGDPAGAGEAIEQSLGQTLRVLGPDHPSTLIARGVLANWKGQIADPAAAADDLEKLLDHMLRVLGKDHPHTLTCRGNLAFMRSLAGDLHAAVDALEKLLEDQLRTIGPDHPSTLTCRNNLARWRGQAGDPVSAVAALELLLEDRLRILGPNHPDLLITRHDLAVMQGLAGELASAVAALEVLLEERLRILGPDHPDPLTTRHDLAVMQGLAGNPTAAVDALVRLLKDEARILGPDHPDTQTVQYSLEQWRRVAKQRPLV